VKRPVDQKNEFVDSLSNECSSIRRRKSASEMVLDAASKVANSLYSKRALQLDVERPADQKNDAKDSL